MDNFAKFYNKQQHRHRGNGFTDVHKTYRRKHLNLVPDTHKTDHTKNQKIERLRDNPGSCVCNKADLQYIRDTYSIVPHKDREQSLGKTGIKLYYDPKTKVFMLMK